MTRVTLIDYGIGNLLNVARALEHVGATVEVADNAPGIAGAGHLVLPGVGAFSGGMAELKARGMVDVIRQHAEKGRPFLGICLGMQLMLDSSEEFGQHAGLGLVPGKVVAIPRIGASGQPNKIPHIGWNELLVAPGHQEWQRSILSGLKPGAAMYFVHSFMVVPDDPGLRVANCNYDGVAICATLSAGNLHGCQFHPEKSGEAGLTVLRRFCGA
jgi:glutamine amidotransferase